MSWLNALAAWLLIVVAVSAVGAIRYFYFSDAPTAGLLGALFGPVILFAITWSQVRRINAQSFTGQLKVGLLWFILSSFFEVGCAAMLGRSLQLAHLLQGGMGPGLLFVPFAPTLAAQARGFSLQPSISVRMRLRIGVLGPVAIYALLALVVPPFGSDVESWYWSSLIFLFATPVVAVFNLWVLLIKWTRSLHCAIAGMYIPTVIIVFKIVSG